MFKRKPTDCRQFADAPPEGRSICHLDMGADAPDTSRQDGVAEQMARMSEEQWNWTKNQFAEQAPTRQRAADTADAVSRAGIESMGLQNQISRDYTADRNNIYRPMEQRLAAEAEAYDTPERRAAAAAEGVADVGMQAEAARQAQTRQQQRMGVNPSSGKAVALQSQMGLGEAAAKAGAANTARDKVETVGRALKMDAINIGRGNASSQATSAGLALNAGGSATSAAVTPVNVAQSGVGMVQQGLGTSLNGLNGAAGIYSNSSNQQWQASQAAASGVGDLLGAGMRAYAMSDENMKTGREDVKPEASLSSIRRLPDSESWRYKDSSPANDGGQTHTGPMAQDVNKAMGDDTAPGGKVIDLVSMNGHTLNAIKALDQKTTALQREVKSLKTARKA
jgi:hypothetical protein